MVIWPYFALFLVLQLFYCSCIEYMFPHVASPDTYMFCYLSIAIKEIIFFFHLLILIELLSISSHGVPLLVLHLNNVSTLHFNIDKSKKSGKIASNTTLESLLRSVNPRRKWG